MPTTTAALIRDSIIRRIIARTPEVEGDTITTRAAVDLSLTTKNAANKIVAGRTVNLAAPSGDYLQAGGTGLILGSKKFDLGQATDSDGALVKQYAQLSAALDATNFPEAVNRGFGFVWDTVNFWFIVQADGNKWKVQMTQIV